MSLQRLAIVAALLAATTVAIPHGFSAFFDADACPSGWGELNAAQGRLIVSVTSPSVTGVTVNQPLLDQEDRSHAHGFSAVVSVPQKDIAAIGCCNNEGAHHGQYSINNNTASSTSGYPFSQLLLCTFQGHNDTAPVAYGTIGYFDPDVGGCPDNWNPMVDSNGRILIPGYEQGGSMQNGAAPLASGEDRQHHHNFSISFPTTDVSYVGAEGCCDSGPAAHEDLVVASTADSTSTDLPYVQLLTCVNQVPTFNHSFPADALTFSTISCPPGWDVVNEVSGRFLVALPVGGSPGASFGGDSIPSASTENPTHNHHISGSLTLPSVGVGLASGCCGNGYIGAGTYGFQGHTSDDSELLPYTMVPLCRNSLDSGRGSYLKKGTAARASLKK
ncbi:Hypothetical protein, putative [Bodo saltans]|uniref:YHYH domain-containing protein n=1 Tax=Bodo saltans TaxID=75058 RepID=A0A0S4IKA4_BODSA|nr:Hypothetical protein, putative [Bodo saltans]|eukprot:CUE64777.1 Hypothetical protein, putative [Bodo saltans]